MNFFEGKRVVVTGAAGLIGHETIRQLLDLGAIVLAVIFQKRVLKVPPHKNLNTFFGDLRDYPTCLGALYGADIVIDAAAVTGGAKKQKLNQLTFARDNTVIHVNVITAAVEQGVSRFGFIGSSTMYPVREVVVESEGFDEDPWEGYMGVGWTKRYLEKLCMLFNNTTDTKFAIARTTAVYGPHDDFNLETCHVIPALVNKIAHRQDPLEIWGAGDEIRNFIYVEDFVNGLLEMIKYKTDADPVNIASVEKSTVKDIIKYGIEYMEYKPELNFDLSKPTMLPKRIVDVYKVYKLLQWEAKTPLKEGIEKTIKWYQENYL
jgi:GDP-L-fucose synthase